MMDRDDVLVVVKSDSCQWINQSLKKVKLLLQKENSNDLNLCRNSAGHDFLTGSSQWI